MIKTSRIGEINFGKMKTEFCMTSNAKAILKKWKISPAILLPPGWAWYDSELLERIDENSDGKPDEKFGNDFKVIYFLPDNKEAIKEFEKEALFISDSRVKNIKFKYAALKCQR